jgi:hypothetical protein
MLLVKGKSLRTATGEIHVSALGAVSMQHPVPGPVSLYHYIAVIGAHEAGMPRRSRVIAELFGVVT